MTHSAIANDPVIAAVEAFRDVERGFQRWLDQDQECFLDRDEVARHESGWQDSYEAGLTSAADIVPLSLHGVQALAAVYTHQSAMGASPALLDSLYMSMCRGLAGLPDSELGGLVAW